MKNRNIKPILTVIAMIILAIVLLISNLRDAKDETTGGNAQITAETAEADITSVPTEEPVPTPTEAPTPTEEPAAVQAAAIDENGVYDSKDQVALYIHTYGHLPSNYITKKQAQALGWSGGGLDAYAPGKCIGGDYYGNYEGVLPEGNYHECDIDTMGKSKRGAKRIVYDADGDIYYTKDHYEHFEQLY